MWVREFEGIKFSLDIRGYNKPIKTDEEYKDDWCKVYFYVKLDKILNYLKVPSEILLSSELDHLITKIEDLLNDRLDDVVDMSFAEPDISFTFRPKYDLRNDPNIIFLGSGSRIVDISATMHIMFWNNTYATSNCISIYVDREDLTSLLDYLYEVVNKDVVK